MCASHVISGCGRFRRGSPPDELPNPSKQGFRTASTRRFTGESVAKIDDSSRSQPPKRISAKRRLTADMEPDENHGHITFVGGGGIYHSDACFGCTWPNHKTTTLPIFARARTSDPLSAWVLNQRPLTLKPPALPAHPTLDHPAADDRRV